MANEASDYRELLRTIHVFLSTNCPRLYISPVFIFVTGSIMTLGQRKEGVMLAGGILIGTIALLCLGALLAFSKN